VLGKSGALRRPAKCPVRTHADAGAKVFRVQHTMGGACNYLRVQLAHVVASEATCNSPAWGCEHRGAGEAVVRAVAGRGEARCMGAGGGLWVAGDGTRGGATAGLRGTECRAMKSAADTQGVQRTFLVEFSQIRRSLSSRKRVGGCGRGVGCASEGGMSSGNPAGGAGVESRYRREEGHVTGDRPDVGFGYGATPRLPPYTAESRAQNSGGGTGLGASRRA